MAAADTWLVVRNEDGFTLIELLAAVAIMAILAAIAVGFSTGARVRAADASAKSNIAVALPAIDAYYLDKGTYAGMTVPILQSSYSKGIQGIVILSAGPSHYCVRSVVDEHPWYKLGPEGPITNAYCV